MPILFCANMKTCISHSEACIRAWPYIVPCVLSPVYAIRAPTIQTSYNIR
jgi:hypothetical protein